MFNEWFIIANRFSNSGKTAGVIEKALKKLKDEKIKYSFNLTNNSGDEIKLVKKATSVGYNKILVVGGGWYYSKSCGWNCYTAKH